MRNQQIQTPMEVGIQMFLRCTELMLVGIVEAATALASIISGDTMNKSIKNYKSKNKQFKPEEKPVGRYQRNSAKSLVRDKPKDK